MRLQLMDVDVTDVEEKKTNRFIFACFLVFRCVADCRASGYKGIKKILRYSCMVILRFITD